MNKYIRQATVEDIEFLAPRLRQADKAECYAAFGIEPLPIMKAGLVEGDETLTLVAPTGVPVGVLGVVASEIEGAGSIWLVASDDIHQYQMTFLRHSKPVLTVLEQNYLALHNYVDARNELHIKWLKWMGFTFINLHQHHGFKQLPFYEFIRIRHVCTNTWPDSSTSRDSSTSNNSSSDSRKSS